MLVVDRAAGTFEDRLFRDFPSYVRAGDCVVLNDSRVFPSRLYGHREHGDRRARRSFSDQADFLRTDSLGKRWCGQEEKCARASGSSSSDDLSVEILGSRRVRRTDRPAATPRVICSRCSIAWGTCRCRHTSGAPIRRPIGSGIRRCSRGKEESVAAPTAGLHFTAGDSRGCEGGGSGDGSRDAACRARDVSAHARRRDRKGSSAFGAVRGAARKPCGRWIRRHA